MRYVETIWHKVLSRPYKLATPIKSGKGDTAIFLHGLGGKAKDWEKAFEKIDAENLNIIAFDLLGFGKSPSPDWLEYDVDDHAKSVSVSIKSNSKKPVILVGHSMGAVVAARVARNHPDTVKHLILYQVPIYSKDSDALVYSPVHKGFLSLFTYAINNPKFTMKFIDLFGKVSRDESLIKLNDNNWMTFQRSLKNTVMKDTVYDDLNSIKAPVDVIYGTYDVLVVKRKMKKVFKDTSNIHFHEVRESHKITKKTGTIINRLILERRS